MKRLFLTFLFLISTSLTFSQTKYFYGYNNDIYSRYDFTHYGKISLGELVNSNSANLTVFKDGNATIELKNNHGRLEILKSNCYGCGYPLSEPGASVIRNLGGSHTLIFSMPDNANDGSERVIIGDDFNKNNFIVYNNGKVTIGTDNFDSENYNLYVKNGIKTEKIKVEFADVNGWADYVFDVNYKLMSLGDLEIYIKNFKHLPEIPTTKEVLEDGVELKKLNVLLLKKIEELTLHVIELDKKVKKLEKLKF